MEATPRPWRLLAGALYGPEGYDYGCYTFGPIATINSFVGPSIEPGKTSDRDFPEAEANARLIVEAVNSYDAYRELLEAAKGITAAIDAHHPDFSWGPYTLTREEVANLRAAIAKVEEVGS